MASDSVTLVGFRPNVNGDKDKLGNFLVLFTRILRFAEILPCRWDWHESLELASLFANQ
jgi:hypothetical protein